MNKLKILIVMLIAFITQASCCGDMDKTDYEALIPPVRVYKKYDSHLVLKDAKDNQSTVMKVHGGWSDSVYRNHKEGDILDMYPHVISPIKEKKKGWLE